MTPAQINSLHKALERDIAQLARNQTVIDRLKRVTRKEKLLIKIRDTNWWFIAASYMVFVALSWLVAYASASRL